MTKNRPRKLFGFIILIFSALVCTYLFLHSSFFNIDKICITGQSKVSQEEILALSGLSLGVNVFEVNSTLCSRAVEIHPMVKSAQIVRHLPREIEIKVQERKVWAITPYKEYFLGIDAEGICIDKIVSTSLLNYPIITMDRLPEHVNLGQPIEPEAMGMVKNVWDSLPDNTRDNISDFHYLNGSQELLIYTAQGTEVRFGSQDRLEEKVVFLKQVFQIEKDFNKTGSNALEYVDLRFKGQPVVKTKI